MPSPQTPPIKLQLPELSSTLATQASKDRWKADLNNLLKHAHHRFADLAWSIGPAPSQLIWAHKAIIYARAGGQFQLKYLSATAPPPHSRLPVLPSNSSAVSISPYPNSLRSGTPQSSSSARRPPSPSSGSLNSLTGSIRQIAVLNGTDPTLFQSILEALYTANGLSEVFSFLFDDQTTGDGPEARTDKLRRDLLYMWRSKLYADCRIVLVDENGESRMPDGSTSAEQAVFSAHRAVLCSRSPYFASLLLDPYADSNNRLFTLASPPFTPASLHFSLGYLYCGTLEFSARTFDLATAMQIWRSAQYLGLELLKEEVEAKISDMCHNFKDNCKSCISRIGRVYAFAVALDVNSKRLEKAAEPFVVQSFGLIWNKAIGELHYEAQTRIVDMVCSGIDPNTVIDAIRSSKRLKERLSNERSDWSDHLLSMSEPIDEQIAGVLQKKFPAVVTSKGFLDLLVGVGFSNDVLERALVILVQQLSQETAAETYQVLVGQVLLREDGLPMDARVIVEDAKASVLRYIKSRWMDIRSSNGFDPLENWALKEIADEIEVQVDDLLLSSVIPETPITKTGLRITANGSKDLGHDEKQSISAASLRASVLCRNASRKQEHSPVALSSRVTTKSTSTASTVITATTDRLHLTSVTNNSLDQPSSPSIISRPRPKIGPSKPTLPTSSVPTPRRGSENLSPSTPTPPTVRRTSAKSIETAASTSSAASPKSEPASATKPNNGVVSSASKPRTQPTRSGPPLPPLPNSTPVTRSSLTSRASSPTQSVVSNSSSRAAGKRTASVAARSRRPSVSSTASNLIDSKASKPPRARTLTSGSSSSTRPAASVPSRPSASSGTPNGRKLTTAKAASIRKTPSTMSMRSDISNITVGATHGRRVSGAVKSTIAIPPSPLPSSRAPTTTARKKSVVAAAAAAVTLAPAKRPDRLRTTSATARTGAATLIRPTQPMPLPKRPSSVTSIRPPVSTKTNGMNKPEVGKAEKGADVKSAKGKTKEGLPVTSSTLKLEGLGVRARTVSNRLPTPSLSARSVRARKVSAITPGTSAEVKKLEDEIKVTGEETTEVRESGHKSKGSTASNSTIRIAPTIEVPAGDPGTQTIIVTPSSSPSIHRITTSALPPPNTRPPGTTLLIGISCVVATTTVLPDGMVQPIKFRAVVKYLGETFFEPGQWVGVEVAEKENMPSKDWNDGAVDGVRYFELGQESPESRTRLMRNLSATPSAGDRRSPSALGQRLGSPGWGGSEEGSLRPSLMSLKTTGSDDELNLGIRTRGLFVRPHEVIFVF